MIARMWLVGLLVWVGFVVPAVVVSAVAGGVGVLVYAWICVIGAALYYRTLR